MKMVGVFFSANHTAPFCHPLTQNNNCMFLRDILREDCVPCTCFSQNCMYSKELSGICRLPSHLESLWGHERHLETHSVLEKEIIVPYVYIYCTMTLKKNADVSNSPNKNLNKNPHLNKISSIICLQTTLGLIFWNEIHTNDLSGQILL